MIIDYLKHIHRYRHVLPHFDQYGHLFSDLVAQSLGRIEINETDYVTIFQGQTQPMAEGAFEFHHNYLDIQIVLEGKEQMQWQDRSLLEVTKAYDGTSDIGFAQGTGQSFDIYEGMFYIVFPHDAHMPGRHLKEQTDFKKAVFKIKVSE